MSNFLANKLIATSKNNTIEEVSNSDNEIDIINKANMRSF